jgi:uncharacterized delta-60 repeat protein
MKKKRPPQLRHRVGSTRRISVSAPARRNLGEGGFLNRRVLLGMLVFFGALLLALFSIARPQALSSEHTRNLAPHASRPLHGPTAPSGTVQEAWVVRYDGPVHSADSANDLAIDALGNVYVTGGSAVSGGPPDYVTIKYNSAGEQQWIADFSGGNNIANFANAIALDESGNVYVTGIGWGYGNDSDYATVKYNSSGEQQWVARYDGPGHNLDTAMAIAVDPSGNVYVTGRSTGSGANYDCATVKYSPSGQEAWVARYNGPGNGYDEGRAIAVDGSGNVYVTGPSAGSGGDFDYATIKYDASGQEEWIARYNGPGNATDFAYGLVLDSSGNAYVTGASVGSGTGSDAATIKYNLAGQQQWIARYNGPGNDSDGAYAIALDGSGNVIVTGGSVGTTYPDYDYATIKYNSAGQQQWVARYDGPAHNRDEAPHMAVDGSGNIYVTGYSTGLGTDYDYATIKYSPSGEEEWVARYNAPANFGDVAYGVAVDSSGNVYVTGSSAGMGTNSDYATVKYVQGPTPTPTATASPTPTQTPTPSPSATATPTVTPTAAPTATVPATPTATPRATPTPRVNPAPQSRPSPPPRP